MIVTLRRSLAALAVFTAFWYLGTDEVEAQAKAKAKTKKVADAPPEAAVRGTKTSREPSAIAANLDRLIDERLKADKIPASPLADDAEFIRRLSLDVRGRVPSGERVATFLADTDSQKRAKLIDEFLADSEYGEHFAIIWYHRMIQPDDENRQVVNNNKLQGWLAERFNQNVGWDRMVSDILTASGARDTHPATAFWLQQVGDFRLGQPEPNKATAAASKLFLGVKLECAECHNHPFSTMKQTDFWSTAAFFSQTHAENSGRAQTKAGATPSVREGGSAPRAKKKDKDKEEKAKPAAFGSIHIPFTKDKVVQATLLGNGSPVDLTGKKELRPLFAAWATSPKNPYFARAAANKLWANFFGKGIVQPVDDMREDGTNTHPEVLTLLANELAESSFDLKHLIRCICQSQTYQRTSRPTTENKEDGKLYSHMPTKVMSADMLYDSLNQVLGHSVGQAQERGDKKMAKKKGGGGPRDQFRKFFHAEADDDSGVVEDYTHGIPQVLRLMNAKQTNDLDATVAKLTKDAAPDKAIEALYLTALSRKPTDAEMKKMKAYVASEKDPAQGYRDVFWALLNSGEFVIIH
jgi:hypothetical protein